MIVFSFAKLGYQDSSISQCKPIQEIITMKKSIAVLGLLGIALAGPVFAKEGKVPEGVRHLDHVFVIMMENHGYSQIMNNPNAPFVNDLAHLANLATNYSVSYTHLSIPAKPEEVVSTCSLKRCAPCVLTSAATSATAS